MTLEPTATGSGTRDLRLLAKSLAIVLLLAGCASYDGRGLVPGQSRAADVEAVMGPPAEKLAAGSDSVWYYTRNPYGMHTFAVRIGPDGVMRGIEQRLTVQNIRRLAPGVTTAREAREILGPPWRVARDNRQGGEAWDYRMLNDSGDVHNLSVLFSGDGVVRQIYLLKELVNEPCAT